MLKDVVHKITDYGLGSSTVKGEGVHIKIGVSEVESNVPITITHTMEGDEIRELLGYSPLSDSIIESLNAGCSTIYAMPVKSGIDGTIKTDASKITGTGVIEVEGKPTHAYNITVKITASGKRNEGAFKVYIENGESIEEAMIPDDGEYLIPTTGLKLKFSEGQYNVGESVQITTTKPRMNNEGVLEALSIIKDLSINFEFIHIVGESEKDLWAALSIEGDKFFDTYYKPCIFVCETRGIKADEKLAEYMQYLREQRQGVISRNLQVVPARVSYMREGVKADINAASLIMGLHARANVQQSIGEVAVFDITGALEILPSGIESYISELDDLGYTTLRQYAGVEGIYVNNSRTFAKTGSDYVYTERVRTMYKAVRETRKTALLKMHSQVDASSETALQKSLKAITEFINVPVERMVANKELSSARVIIPEGQDILGEEKLRFKIRAVPIGILREIEIDMGFENPALIKEG